MPSSRLTFLLAVALAAVPLALLPSPASAAAPREFVGLQGWEPPSLRDWSRLDRANVRLWRVFFYWTPPDTTEGAPDPYRLARYDEMFERAAAAGVRILPVVIRNSTLKQPRTRDARLAFHAFAAAIARRYGRRGELWQRLAQERPALKPLPVNKLQVWNEPNHPHYWQRPRTKHWVRPAAREYARFVIGVARAIRAANPRVKVVIGGILNNKREPFLKAFYRVRGARRAFDVMAIHSYSSYPSRVSKAVDTVRWIMRRHGDSRKPIMLTEVGLATHSPDRRLSTTERGQARFLKALYAKLLHKRRSRRLIGAIWFSYRDRQFQPNYVEWWAGHTGLFRRSDRPKKAWTALLRVTGGRR